MLFLFLLFYYHYCCHTTHRVTAAALVGITEGEVTAEQRQLAKAINFGLVYGQSALGLQRYAAASYGVALSADQAQLARRKFFAAYPGVAAWQREQRQKAGRGAEVSTPSGRVARHLQAAWREAAAAVVEGAAAEGARALGRLECEALNFPIQGGAAEVMLACLDRLRARLLPLRDRCCLVCVVHDEFLLECRCGASAEAAASALRRAMLEAWSQVFPAAAPLDDGGVAISAGPSWAMLEPIL